MTRDFIKREIEYRLKQVEDTDIIAYKYAERGIKIYTGRDGLNEAVKEHCKDFVGAIERPEIDDYHDNYFAYADGLIYSTNDIADWADYEDLAECILVDLERGKFKCGIPGIDDIMRDYYPTAQARLLKEKIAEIGKVKEEIAKLQAELARLNDELERID